MIKELPKDFDLKALQDHWLKVNMSTDPVDHTKVEEALTTVYELCGFSKPNSFIWYDSPVEAAYDKSVTNNESAIKFKDDLWDELWDVFLNNLSIDAEAQISADLLSTLHEAMWEDNYNKVETSVNAKVLNELLETSAQPVKEFMKEWWTFFFGGTFGSTFWVGYYDVCRQVGVKFDSKINALLDAFIILANSGYYFPFQDTVICCEKPVEIHKNGQFQLHNETGPSILYKDGFSLWDYHGVSVPREVIEDPSFVNVKTIMAESNSEIRRVMYEIMGWDKFIEEAQLKLIDESDDPGNIGRQLKLYNFPDKFSNSGPMNLLFCINGTPKPNGEIPQYGITVPKEVKKAVEAAAWVANMPLEVYSQLERRT